MQLLQAWKTRTQKLGADICREPTIVQELLDAYTVVSPSGAVCLVEVLPGSSLALRERGLQLTLNLICRDDYGKPSVWATWSIDTSESYAELVQFRVRSDWQRHGLGRNLIRRTVLVYRDLGLQAITLRAEEIGAYAWATMGFDFFDGEEREEVLDWVGTFAIRLGIRDIDFSKVIHSWDLASLGKDAEFVSPAEIARASGKLAHIGGDQLHLGKAFLLGSGVTWSGTLTMDEGNPGYVSLMN